MHIRNQYLLFFALLVLGCNKKTTPKILASDIALTITQGQWQTGEMFINYESYNNSNQDSTLLLNQFNYESVMGSSLQQITFKSDGNYVAKAIRFQNGDTIQSLGHWQSTDNNISIDFGPIRNSYQVIKLKTDSVKLKGVIDLDQDGEIDDTVEFVIVKSQ